MARVMRVSADDTHHTIELVMRLQEVGNGSHEV